MLYSEVIDYLYQRLPLFQNQGAVALKNGLEGVLKLCERLGNPHKKLKAIHIAGTNGKGSTSHMLASILQESGLKTGLYTSPHLVDFRERIKINGELITEAFVIDFVENNRDFFEENSFSFFEVTVALAFQYFVVNEVNIALIEVGLGGRLDSTNIINPILSVITNISDDHKQILGETLPEIAFEKAGIIKENVPVVISTSQKEVENVFKNKAKETSSEIYFADQNYKIAKSGIKNNYQEIDVLNLKNDQSSSFALDLLGTYQQFNVLGVVQAIDILCKKGYQLNFSNVYNGLSKVQQNTGLMGRWQFLGLKPAIICDTGHNFAGINEVIKNIKLQQFNRLHIVLGFVKDKEIDKILPLLPQTAIYYFCNANIPRALLATDLAEKALEFKLNGDYFATVANAFIAAKKSAQAQDLIFIGGSTFVVADLLKFLQENNNG
jgi:dihydrofolate synthase / folylpolyglutamate synthase